MKSSSGNSLGIENTKLSVEYYGDEPGDPVKITVVNHGGRLFLKIHNDKVTILDESSEVKLREGVFNAKEELAAKEKNIDGSVRLYQMTMGKDND